MRVMHVFSGRERGGIASVVLPLLKELTGEGLEVRTVCLSDGPMVSMARALGLDPLVIRRGHFMDCTLIVRLAALIRRERVDIVHTHSVSGNFYGRLASFLARCSITITSVHADTLGELKDAKGSVVKARVWHGIDLYMERFSKLIIANSGATGELLGRKGVRAGKLRVVYNGIDCTRETPPDRKTLTEELGIEDGARIVGSVGRLTGTKNYRLFLRSARRIMEKNARAFFLIVGDGPERPALRALAREMGMEDRVIITGWREDVERYFGIMDVFVLSSLKEGFGLVILEAMKHSLPVVATRVGGVPEVVVDGKTGFLVPSGDEAGLADKVTELLADPLLCRRLGKSGRKRLEEKFSIKKMAMETREIYIEAS